MLNPCKSNKSYILGNSIYNITTPVTPRYSLPYVKPTPDMFQKHKQSRNYDSLTSLHIKSEHQKSTHMN